METAVATAVDTALATGCPAVFVAGRRPGSAAREAAAGAAFADLVASLLVAGHEVRPGWKRGSSMGAGGCRCSGRSLAAAGRCAVTGLTWQRWIQAGSFGARGWRLQRFSAADGGREADTTRSLSKIRIPGAHVRRRRLFTQAGSIAATGKEWRRRRTISMPLSRLSISGSIKARQCVYVASANCFRRIYERLFPIVAEMR